MAVTADKPAPYAPPSAILDVIDRYRNRGLPSPVNSEVLGRAGVSDSLIPRTLQALQTLELIDDDGNPTEFLESIRLASEPEYREQLAQWLNKVYADVLSFIDPAHDDETAIRDAFRSYKPIGQQSRMVTLFLGLFASAGIVTEKKALPRKIRETRSSIDHRPIKKTNRTKQNKPAPSAPNLPQPLTGLLSSLPAEGEAWTQVERDKFFTTFGAVLDFCFSIKEATTSTAPNSEESEEETI